MILTSNIKKTYKIKFLLNEVRILGAEMKENRK